MLTLNSIDLSLEELGAIALPDGTESNHLVRQSGVTLVWTLLPVFDMYALNIFAKNGFIFWNFFQYSGLSSSEQHAYAPLLSPDRMAQTHSALSRLIKQAGHAKKSAFSCKSLGIWTHTAEFCPPTAPTSWRYMHLRHLSILIPKVDREAVQSHFEEQWRCFGSDALMVYPDGSELVDFGDIRGTPYEKLLYGNIASTTADERMWLYDEVLKYQSAESLSKLAGSLDIRFGAKGLFNLGPVPLQFASFVDADRYADVLRLRARIALLVCPLPQIEKLALRVKTIEPYIGEYAGDLRNELFMMLDSRLMPFRSTIDFELPSQKP